MSDASEHLKKWVGVTTRDVDEDKAVLAELDVTVPETIDELEASPDVFEYSFTADPIYDGPYDLLWFGKGKWRIAPRTEWRPLAQPSEIAALRATKT